MKKIIILSLILTILCGLGLLSCAPEPERVYGLRDMSATWVHTSDYGSGSDLPFKNEHIEMTDMPIRKGIDVDNPAMEEILTRTKAAGDSWSYAYEYGTNAHVYYTKCSITKDSHGKITDLYTQTLNNNGFPTEKIHTYPYGNDGSPDPYNGFKYTYEYTYDESRYLMTKKTCYKESNTITKYKYYGKDYTYDSSGKITYLTYIYYNSDGSKFKEGRTKYFANTPKGFGRHGWSEYYNYYDTDGVLDYSYQTIIGADGYPTQYIYTEYNPDGSEKQKDTYYDKTTINSDGFIIEEYEDQDFTIKAWKGVVTYGSDGYISKNKIYDVSGNEWVYDNGTEYIWYKNPISGTPFWGYSCAEKPIDENGDPTDYYNTKEWTASKYIEHTYNISGQEIETFTIILKKIELP